MLTKQFIYVRNIKYSIEGEKLKPDAFYLIPELILKNPKTDSYRQYIAYHEGWGNNKNYKKNKKVILFAKKVKVQANLYRRQMMQCKSKLNRKKYIIYQTVVF